MARRRFLAQLAAWPLAAWIPITTFPEHRKASLKIVLKSAWGPTIRRRPRFLSPTRTR